MKRLGVVVRLHTEVDAELIKDLGPDIVVVATGSLPFIPQIKGIEEGHVVRAVEALTGGKGTGSHIVILGGGRVGCETAEFLALKGKSVTLIEEGDEVGSGVPPRTRMFLLPRLIKEGVKILKKTKVEEIEDSRVKVLQPGKVEVIEADTVVIAMGFLPRTALVDTLEAVIPELKGFFMIGDCAEPRTVEEAVYDGWRIGRRI